MCKVALGVLGASLLDFRLWSVNQFYLAYQGYKDKRKEDWEMTRTLSYYSMIAFRGSNDWTYENTVIPIDKMSNTYKDKKRAKWRKIK